MGCTEQACWKCYIITAPRLLPGTWLSVLWLMATVATVVLDFPWCQFLFWLVVLPRLLVHVFS